MEKFAGKYILEKRENYEEFAAASAATPEQIEKGRAAKPVTEIAVDGNTVTVKRIFANQTTSNTVTLGVPSEVTFIEGKTAKATVSFDGGKILTKGEKFSSVSEIEGGKLKETLTFNQKQMTRWSVRQ